MSQLERIQENKARKASKSKSAGREWHGFVDLPLSQADKERLADSVFSSEQVVEFLEAATGQGYKLSITPDPEHGCTIATLTGVGSRNPNLGYSLSARGPDPVGALMAVSYKAEVIAEWGAWVDHGNPRDNSPFG